VGNPVAHIRYGSAVQQVPDRLIEILRVLTRPRNVAQVIFRTPEAAFFEYRDDSRGSGGFDAGSLSRDAFGGLQ
jgi:hypothetical protein